MGTDLLEDMATEASAQRRDMPPDEAILVQRAKELDPDTMMTTRGTMKKMKNTKRTMGMKRN